MILVIYYCKERNCYTYIEIRIINIAMINLSLARLNRRTLISVELPVNVVQISWSENRCSILHIAIACLYLSLYALPFVICFAKYTYAIFTRE